MAEGRKRAGRRKKDALLPRTAFRDGFRQILQLPVENEEQRRRLEELGVEPSYLNQILLAGIRKAAGGDTAAARFIRDTVCEGDRTPDGSGEHPDLSGLSDSQLWALAEGGEPGE